MEQARALRTYETQGLCTTLTLKTTAKYLIAVNVDTPDGLVNGATGVLREIGFSTSSTIVYFLDTILR